MSAQEIPADKDELSVLCQKVRELVGMRDYERCARVIAAAMSKYPHAPHPHNLLGVLLERKGDHLTAMKHFRAAWALDPTYLPARQNLDCFGTFFSHGKCAFDESDCRGRVENPTRFEDTSEASPQNRSHAPSQTERGRNDGKHDNCEIEYDSHGIGHVVRRT